MKRFTKLLSMVLAVSMSISIMVPCAQAAEISAKAVAYVEENGDLIIQNGGMEIKVTMEETDTQIVAREYHDGALFQEVTMEKADSSVMTIKDYELEGATSDQPVIHTEEIPQTAERVSFTPYKGKEYVGTLSGTAEHLQDADLDFKFSVRVYNEITKIDQSTITLPNTAKTVADWAVFLVSAYVAIHLPAEGALRAIAQLVTSGSLAYTATDLLMPSSRNTTVSCSYSDNTVTMITAADDRVYRGRTVTATGRHYLVHDGINPDHNGEIYSEGLTLTTNHIMYDIFDYLYTVYNSRDIHWDR